MEIYDRIWYVHHMPEVGNHSLEEIGLMCEFVKRQGEILEGCAEYFPYEMIDELKVDYSCSGGKQSGGYAKCPF